MEDIKDFETFYQLKIAPHVKGMTKLAHHKQYWFIGAIVCLVFLIISFIYVDEKNGQIGIIVIAGIALFYSLYKYYSFEGALEETYKNAVINNILQLVYPGTSFEQDKYISSKHFAASCLYRTHYDTFTGEDFFKGNYKNVPFKCSEIKVAEDNGNIFKGLFFMAQIQTCGGTGTYCWSRGNEQLGKSVLQENYLMRKMPEVIKLKKLPPALMSKFTTCATNVAHAYSILTEERMQAMLNFYSKINRNISFSFVNHHCYVAVPFEENLFEAGRDPGNKETIKSYFQTILLIFSFIDKLELEVL